MYDLAAFNEMQGETGGRTGQNDEVLRERFAPTGAVVRGRRMFDEGEEAWGEEPLSGDHAHLLSRHEVMRGRRRHAEDPQGR